MKKIICLEEGEPIPEGAKFLYADKVKEPTGNTRAEGGFFSVKIYAEYRLVMKFYYEVEEK